MSREGLIEELKAHSISILELKYSQPTVSVYRGLYFDSESAVKVLNLVEGVDYRFLETECAMMKRINHANIVKLHDCFWLSQGAAHYFVIVTEWCQKDLGKDISQRATNGFPWREPELIDICKQLISALSTLQIEGIAHRDIKPENVFLPARGRVKLGDFGSAKNMMMNQQATTLIGTPYYLSPKLREAFSNGQRVVEHNAIKSDVYSLGLTFLAMAKLGPPPELAKPSVTDADLSRVINFLAFSENFKYLLRAMLVQDEDQRWDFCQLWEWVSKNFPDPSTFSLNPGTTWAAHNQQPVEPNIPGTDSQYAKSMAAWGGSQQANQYSGYQDPQGRTPEHIPQNYPSPQLPQQISPYYPSSDTSATPSDFRPQQGYLHPTPGYEADQYKAPSNWGQSPTPPEYHPSPPAYQPPPTAYQPPPTVYQPPPLAYQSPPPVNQAQFSPQRHPPDSSSLASAPQLSSVSPPMHIPQARPGPPSASPEQSVPQVPDYSPPASGQSPPVHESLVLAVHSPPEIEESEKSEVQPLLAFPGIGPCAEPYCLDCKNEVNRTSEQAPCEVVQLYCRPMEHMFCSRECFRRAVVWNGMKACPLCEEPIDEDTMFFYLGEAPKQQKGNQNRPAQSCCRIFIECLCPCFF